MKWNQLNTLHCNKRSITSNVIPSCTVHDMLFFYLKDCQQIHLYLYSKISNAYGRHYIYVICVQDGRERDFIWFWLWRTVKYFPRLPTQVLTRLRRKRQIELRSCIFYEKLQLVWKILNLETPMWQSYRQRHFKTIYISDKDASATWKRVMRQKI